VRPSQVSPALSVKQQGESEFEVVARGPGLGLEKFSPRPRRPQPAKHPVVSIEVVRGQRTPFPGLFLAVANGLKAFKRVGKSRLPIKRVSGRGVGQMMLTKRTTAELPQKIGDYYQWTLGRKILSFLGKS
jgi:hypothetical protein